MLMNASGEGPERLAEILREIIGLTKTVQTNRPEQSTKIVESANIQKLNIESPELLSAQCLNGIDEACPPCGKQAGEERGEPEDQDRYRE